MSAYNTTLLDEDDNEIYPKTLAENVYDGNTRIDQKVNGIRTDLGNPSSASAVTGADAFSKISKLNSDLVPQRATLGSGIVIERLGKLRILQVSGATVSNGWLVNSSFVIASSDRPTFDIISTCYCVVGTTRSTGYINVSSSGLTAARDGSNTAFSGSIFFSVAWTV